MFCSQEPYRHESVIIHVYQVNIILPGLSGMWQCEQRRRMLLNAFIQNYLLIKLEIWQWDTFYTAHVHIPQQNPHQENVQISWNFSEFFWSQSQCYSRPTIETNNSIWIIILNDIMKIIFGYCPRVKKFVCPPVQDR